jgi:hypothetical protein
VIVLYVHVSRNFNNGDAVLLTDKCLIIQGRDKSSLTFTAPNASY